MTDNSYVDNVITYAINTSIVIDDLQKKGMDLMTFLFTKLGKPANIQRDTFL